MLPITKEERQQEKVKLRKMNTLGQRISYIWSYYHIFILICIGMIFLLVWIGTILYRQTQDTMLYVVSINQPTVTAVSLKPIEEEFSNLQGFDRKKQLLSFDTGMDYIDSANATASEIKLQSFVATKTIDILISTEDFVSAYADRNIFCDLSTVFDDTMVDELSPYFVYTTTNSGENIPIGISLDNSVLAQKVKFSEGSVLSICSMEKNSSVVVSFIQYCFGM